ncbi:three-helix bundle dimerization domain-containing protein [Nocardia bovistercoris]|uniref:Protein-tyrosine-phosphatase-like N-terminal domain-containing protein n=1 Tax=Nocardia bovistercoris TaxID=2785916 RepID=A0A931N2T8_9NOCA|nr:hypothetical protein [Nocardia bovistercoris]MBH0776406.1 hypothetical protein [Nocardia bovistercoris]
MTDSPVDSDRQYSDLTLDQQLALRAAADRLTEEFAGVARENVVNDLLHAAYDHIADHANFDNFVPLLAERYTRELLHAADEQRTGGRSTTDA